MGIAKLMTPPSCFYWSGYTNAMFNIEYTLNSKSVRVAANKTGARTSIGVAFGHHSGSHLTMMQVNSYFHQSIYWHEHAAFQRSSFWRSTAGNDVVVTIIISLFFFFPPVSTPHLPFFSSVATFSHRRSARIKQLI